MKHVDYGDQGLRSILNMDNLKTGGIKTEYGFYAMSAIVKSGGDMYAAEALSVIDEMADTDFTALNKKNHTNQANEYCIIDAMYKVANEVCAIDPDLAKDCIGIMARVEKNNSDVITNEGKYMPSRKQFMQNQNSGVATRLFALKSQISEHTDK